MARLMAKKTLCAVFFDIDDTLYSTTEFAALAHRKAAEAMRAAGINLPTEKIAKEIIEVIGEFTSNYEHHYEKLLHRIPHSSFEGINPALIVAAGVVAYHQTKFTHLKPSPDAHEALKKLAATPLIRGIITDGLSVKQAEKLIRLGIHRLFSPNAIFISDQIGIGKPNPKLYFRACDETGIKPSEAMYVGDHPLRDIDPANRVGMVTVLLKRGGKYSAIKGETRPTYEIRNFRELTAILKKDFGVRV